jgi:small subunit ribosomal protein S17
MSTATEQTSATVRSTRRNVRQGVVVSDKRQKTRTVVVDRYTRHSKYGKIVRLQTKYQVHDADNASYVGDRVEIVSCRPISKTVSWRLVKIIEQAPRDKG